MYVTVDGVPVIVAFPTVFSPTLPDARRNVLDADVDVDAAVTFTVQAPVAVNLIFAVTCAIYSSVAIKHRYIFARRCPDCKTS